MISIIRRYRELLVVVALLVLPTILFLAGKKGPGERGSIDRAVLTVFSPIQKGVFWVVDGAQDIWFDYVYLVNVAEDNQELLRENTRLRGEIVRSEEISRENDRLRRILNFQDRFGPGSVAAPVIAIGARPALSRSIRIGKGSKDGISERDPVVTPEGVVGRVVAVGSNWSDIMLIVDTNSAIPAVTSRSRVRVTIRGTGDLSKTILDHAARTDDIAEDDLLVTSGTGGIFPKGLPIGRVSLLQRRQHGMFQQAEVVPIVDLSRVEEVVVLIGTNRGEGLDSDAKP